MAIVPDCVLNTGIVSIVLDYLLLCDFEARLVFKFTVGKIKQAIRFASSERCLSIMSGNRWAHVLEDHDVVLGHCSLLAVIQGCVGVVAASSPYFITSFYLSIYIF